MILVIAWNVLSLPLLFFILTFMPYFLVFNITNSFLASFEKLIDVYFMIDILVNFNLAFSKKSGGYETNRFKIACKYLRTYFFIDLLTSIPIGWIMESSGNNVNINKFFRIAKLPKLMSTTKMSKILRLSYILKVLKFGDLWRYKIKAKESLFKTIMLGLTTYFVLHLGGCMFIFLGYIESEIPNTWIYFKELEDRGNHEVYISAVYFCFVVLTTVGYGDIRGYNSYERLFTIVWMLFGIAFYSFTISYVTFFFTSKDNRKSLCEKQIKVVERFAKDKNLSRAMTEEIIQNLEYASFKISYRWLEGDFSIFKDMPLELKYDLLKEMHKELLECPFFTSKDQSFVIRMIDLLKPIKLKKDEFLWKKDDKANYIAFLTKGEMFLMDDNIFYDKYSEVEKVKKMKMFEEKTDINILKMMKNAKKMLKRVSENQNIIKNVDVNLLENPKGVNSLEELLSCRLLAFKLFGTGSYLGDEEIFFQTNRRFYLKAANDCELMLLSKIDFDNILKFEFPHIYKKLFSFAEKKLHHNLKIKNRLMTIIGKLSQNKPYVPGENVSDKNMSYCSRDLKVRSENKKIATLHELYTQAEELHPIDMMFRNIDIQEYEGSNDNNVEEFEDIKTPGLIKMYNDWKSKLNSDKESENAKIRSPKHRRRNT